MGADADGRGPWGPCGGPRGGPRSQVAVTLVVLVVAGSSAVRIHGALADPGAGHPGATAVSTAAVIAPAPSPEPAVDAGPETFTIGELAAGTVPQDVQDRFWQSQVDAILAAPCPDAPSAGTTAVTLFLGADETWTALLTDAMAEHAAACAG